MSGGKNAPVRDRPTVAQLEAELARTKYRARYRTVLRSTVYTLVIVVAAAVLVATLWLPVLQIYGNSMTPTLADGDIVVSVKQSDFAQGDVVAFYYNNKILIKRVIAGPGDWVDVKEDGTVFVNGAELNEPYLEEKAFGGCDIDLPYQVPDGSSSWATTTAFPWIPGTRRWAAWPRSRSWAEWCSGSGR